MRNMILADIARLRRMPDLAYKLENYQPQPDPVQQQLQQLELLKLQAEIKVLESQAVENTTKGMVHEAKVGVERARADSLQGDADLKSQTFVDNQTGITHQRELDKKVMDTDAVLKAQQMKNDGNLEKSIAQFGLNKQAVELGHKSDLLKLKAQHDMQAGESGRQIY